jgi:hypothetical protein
MFVFLAAGCSSQAQAAAPQTVETTPDEVVTEFYADYLAYSGDPASGDFRNPMVDRMYAERSDLTDEFITQIDELLASFDGAGYDPLLCAQAIPESITTAEATINGDEAVVHVTTSFIDHSLDVELIKMDGGWKINNIRCGF